MSRVETGDGLKQALASADRKGAGRGFPRELRARVSEFVARRRAAGESDEAIGRELGIRAMTFRRWVGGRASAFSLASVIEKAPTTNTFVVHGPRGMRIEGLDVADLAALWGRLS